MISDFDLLLKYFYDDISECILDFSRDQILRLKFYNRFNLSAIPKLLKLLLQFSYFLPSFGLVSIGEIGVKLLPGNHNHRDYSRRTKLELVSYNTCLYAVYVV